MGDPEGNRPVLVGYDGSPGAEGALCWGAEEAQLRDLPLVICHAWHWPYPFHPLARQVLEQVEGVGAAVLESGVRRTAELAGDLQVRTHQAEGTAAAVVLDAAREAELVVLGSRGHGGFEELQAGSAAVQVPAHSERPVIVVRPTLPPMRRDGVRVVVGVDGSPASQAALAFAFDEAELRGGSVTALCAWWDTAALPGPNRVPFTDTAAMRRDAEEHFEEWIGPWVSRYPQVPATTEFLNERPQQAVNEMAKGAVLLVLGDRGVGSVRGMRLGPVTQAALFAAPCPVAVTPP
jgi:nucleotide-binding universal stress UspA family protein